MRGWTGAALSDRNSFGWVMQRALAQLARSGKRGKIALGNAGEHRILEFPRPLKRNPANGESAPGEAQMERGIAASPGDRPLRDLDRLQLDALRDLDAGGEQTTDRNDLAAVK